MDIGLPSAGEQLVRSSGQFVFSMLVAGLGSVAIAANQIISKSTSMSFMPGIGFGHAATTLIGQNLGAKQPERAERSGYMAAKIAAIFMSCVGLMFFFFSYQLAGLFTKDVAVQQAAGECLKIMAISQPFLAYVMVLAGALRGAGDTGYVLLVTLIGTWGSRVAMGWLLGIYFGLGLKGVWLAMVLDNLIRFAMMLTRYRKGQWKTMRLRSEARAV
jgi:putative MATE family efflux protein